MRKDYEIMKTVASHTRVTPQMRIIRTERLVQSINNTPEIKQELDLWDILVLSYSFL